MSDREAFEKWAAEIGIGDNLVFDTSAGYVGVKEMTWQAWQAAQAQAVNQQLLEALEYYAEYFDGSVGNKARAAIAAAQVNQQLLGALEAVEGAYQCGTDLNVVLDQVKAAIAAAQEQGK